MVLIGSCTHSRRHVDWEIKASLRQGIDCKPNGLLVVLLPYQGDSAHLPPRLKENWNASGNCYAGYHAAPNTAEELARWIEEAYLCRETRANLISNSQEIMKYSQCLVCKETHSLRNAKVPPYRFL